MKKTECMALAAGVAAGLTTVGVANAETDRDEIRAIVAEMMSDAESRSSLLSTAQSGGHDGKKFFLSDASQDFKLNIEGQIQVRYVLNFRDEDAGDDFDPGFENRRTKFVFAGRVYDKFGYKLQTEFGRDGGFARLQDAWVSYDINEDWTLIMGQMKAPLLREELVSSKRQLAAERSITNELFTGDRTTGVALAYTQENWDAVVAITDGARALNTGFSGADADFSITARGQYIIEGDRSAFKDFTSPQNADFAAMVGVAAHYQMGEAGGSESNDPSDIDLDIFRYTVDVSLEGDSWNAFAAFMGDHTQVSALGVDEVETDDFGFVVQGGYRVQENTEIFARWDSIILDDSDRTIDEDFFSFITFGVNQYYHGHAAKATIDAVISLEDTSDLAAATSAVPASGAGILGDMEEGEVAVRFQFQLLF